MAKSGGQGKHGRNLKSPAMKRYNAERRDLTNKARKLRKHLKYYPNDEQAVRSLGLL